MLPIDPFFAKNIDGEFVQVIGTTHLEEDIFGFVVIGRTDKGMLFPYVETAIYELTDEEMEQFFPEATANA